jgi:hypothetical protein
MSVLKRLTVLQNEAAATPVPSRKFFHIGAVEAVDDVGECIPMLSWVDDNLSRYVVSDAPCSAWGGEGGQRGARVELLRCLPNIAVAQGDGVFLVTGSGHDESVPHPGGKGRMHFIHLGLDGSLLDRGLTKLHVYRLEGVQVKNLPARRGPT